MDRDKSLEEHPTSVLQGQTNGGASSTSFAESGLTQMQRATFDKVIRIIYKIHGHIESHQANVECDEETCLCRDIEDDLDSVIRLLEKT